MQRSARNPSMWARVLASTVAAQLALVSSTVVAADGAASTTSTSSFDADEEARDGDRLPPDALEHLRRGAEYYKRRQYPQAEVEFARVAHFAPDWPPLLFNRAAAAEAQGKLVVAIESYQAYMPHADERQQRALELRIAELEHRRVDAKKVVRRQMIAGWSLFGGGVAMAAGGGAMIGVGYGMDEGKRRNRLLTGGYVVGVYGLIMTLSTMAIVAIAHKNRRKLRGLSFTPIGSPHGVGGSLAARF